MAAETLAAIIIINNPPRALLPSYHCSLFRTCLVYFWFGTCLKYNFLPACAWYGKRTSKMSGRCVVDGSHSFYFLPRKVASRQLHSWIFRQTLSGLVCLEAGTSRNQFRIPCYTCMYVICVSGTCMVLHLFVCSM